MENTESGVREKYGKHGVIWKTRSLTSEKNMENTESYGKHGVRRKNMENTESDVKKYGEHGVRRIVNVKYGKQ
jgi:hypothetical protein